MAAAACGPTAPHLLWLLEQYGTLQLAGAFLDCSGGGLPSVAAAWVLEALGAGGAAACVSAVNLAAEHMVALLGRAEQLQASHPLQEQPWEGGANATRRQAYQLLVLQQVGGIAVALSYHNMELCVYQLIPYFCVA